MTGVAIAIQKAAASVLSTLKSKYRTSDKAINFVVNEFNNLTELYLNFIKEELSTKCAHEDGYLTLKGIFSKLDALRGQSLFEGVASKPYLDSFIAHKSMDNKPFALKQIVFDTKVVFRKGIPYKVPKDFALFPPFLPQLEQLLNCKDVLHCVDNPREKKEGVFKSVTDGLLYRFSYIVRRYGNKVLCIIIYVDDVEFADPCKSKTKKHKLRLFYWTLGNIYPELRSSLKAINLLAIARTEVAKKWGNEAILKYFIEDMVDLADGVKLCINGEDRLFHGMLQFVAADMPAAANLGGFKESHFALRPCRVCMATRFEMCDHFVEDDRLLRKLEEHKKYVNEIEGLGLTAPAATLIDVDITQQDCNDINTEEDGDMLQESLRPGEFHDHNDPSVNYGVNRRSVLEGAPGFDVTKCLPIDIMHALLEGVAELVCRLTLRDMCTRPRKPKETTSDPTQCGTRKRKRKKSEQDQMPKKPTITLACVNKIIQEASDFGHLNVSRPSPMERDHLDTKLKQSASQMIVLLHVLPIIAYGHIAKEKLELLGQVIRILSFAMKFETSDEDAVNLSKTVQEFGENFVKCYPGYKTLNLHCLKHLEMQIKLHGPLRQQACFRYEAMHREFTRLVDIINNMKNIEFSLACRHICQRNCDILNGMHDGTYLYSGDMVHKSEFHKLDALQEKDVILLSFPELHEETDVATVTRFETYGRSWHKDVVFSLPDTQADSAGKPMFGIIVKICVINNEMILLYNNLKVNYLDAFHAFEVQSRDNHGLKCLKFSDIRLQFPIPRFIVQLGANRIRSYLLPASSGDIM